jgi:hypothetical protein
VNPIVEQDACRDIFTFVGQCVAILWKDWPRDMESVAHDPNGNFALIGTCPYPTCNRPSTFVRVQSTKIGIYRSEGNVHFNKWVAVMQCQACQNYILGIAEQQNQMIRYKYLEHYPIGSPDETVAEEIPDHIKDDFKEALRCLWVKAYNATAEMCRRAIEASCLHLGAPKKDVLEDMIDWLEERRKITPDLKQAAHKVRLGGNRGAHPQVEGMPSMVGLPPQTESILIGPVEKIEKEHAEAIVDFTRHFFQYVYVIPKQLDKYDFSKPKAAKP